MAHPGTHTITIFPLASDGEDRRAEELEELNIEEIAHGNRPLVLIRSLLGFERPIAALLLIQRMISVRDDSEFVARCCVEAGKIREWLREFETAGSCYREAVALDPQDEEVRYLAHNNLGFCLNQLGRHVEAEAWCRKAITIDNRRSNAFKNLGVALEGQDRADEAAGSYAAAVRAQPEDPRALRRLRILLAQRPELSRDGAEWLEVLPATSQAVPESSARSVERFLGSIRVDESLATEELQVFGLRWEAGNGLVYRTLDEALAGGTFEVTEVGEAGQVPRLHVNNRSGECVFLMAGEELVGAKQNRVLNASLLIAPYSEIPMPVSCVEQGRWARRTRKFATAGTSSHSKLRHAMARSTHDSYRAHGSPDSNQGVVWREVARKLMAHKAKSPSDALHEAYQSMSARLEQMATKFAVREQWSGALFAYGGAIVGLDLFDRPATLAKLWPKILRAYAIDALEGGNRTMVSREQVEEWLHGCHRPAMERFASPGLGTDIRMEGSRMIGAMLLQDEHPVHFEAFAYDET